MIVGSGLVFWAIGMGCVLTLGGFFGCLGWCVVCFFGFFGEFDPGSGRTLAACLTHASRTGLSWFLLGWVSGERVSNT